MKSLWQWCRDHRHEKMMEQYKTLCLKLRGHYQYYGVRANYKMLEVVMKHAVKGMAVLAEPEEQRELHPVGHIRPAVACVSATQAQDIPCHMMSLQGSKVMHRACEA